MSKPKNYISYEAAVDTLRRFYAGTTSDTVTVNEAITAAGRNDMDDKTNKNWLNNRMTQLRYHNLIKSTYTYDKRHKLTGMQLTLTGKKALGKVGGFEVQQTQPELFGDQSVPAKASLADVAKAVKAFQEANPEFEVTFDVKFIGVQPIAR